MKTTPDSKMNIGWVKNNLLPLNKTSQDLIT